MVSILLYSKDIQRKFIAFKGSVAQTLILPDLHMICMDTAISIIQHDYLHHFVSIRLLSFCI